MKTDLYHRGKHSISPTHVELIGSMLPAFYLKKIGQHWKRIG